MPSYDILRGLIGQSMGGPRPPVVNTGIADLPQWLPGTYSWTVPQSGFYKFWLWSGGGGGAWLGGSAAGGGGSGAYAEKTKYLSKGQAVTIVVGARGLWAGSSPTSGGTSSITFPDGTVVQCTGGVATNTNTGGAGGVATGGDVNLNGSAGGTWDGISPAPGTAGLGTSGGAGGATDGSLRGGGGGAPANLPFAGGKGGDASNSLASGADPASGGGCVYNGTNPGSNGGIGLAIVQYKGA